MDVRSVLFLFVFLSATPAFAHAALADETEEDADLPAHDLILMNLGAQTDAPSQVNRSPAVLGPATDQPVVYSAITPDDADQPADN